MSDANKIVAWIGPIASILAAVFAGYVSISTTRIQKDVSNLEISSREAIAELETSTKKSISTQDAMIKKAEVFKDLIDDLTNPETAGFALLALWQMMENDKEKRVILAVALSGTEMSRKAVDALILAGEEVEPRIQEILAHAQDRGDKSLEQSAKKAIFGNVDDESAMEVLTAQIFAQSRPVSPCNKLVDHLISVLKGKRKLIAEVEKLAANGGAQSPIFAYVLYKVGTTQHMFQLLSQAELSPGVANLIQCARFSREDWPRALNYAVKQLEKEDVDKYIKTDLVQALVAIHLDTSTVDTALRNRIIAIAEAILTDAEEYEFNRFYAVECLVEWSKEDALRVIAKVLSEDLAEGRVLNKIEETLESTKQHSLGLKYVFGDRAIPSARSGKRAWVDWMASQKN